MLVSEISLHEIRSTYIISCYIQIKSDNNSGVIVRIGNLIATPVALEGIEIQSDKE